VGRVEESATEVPVASAEQATGCAETVAGGRAEAKARVVEQTPRVPTMGRTLLRMVTPEVVGVVEAATPGRKGGHRAIEECVIAMGKSVGDGRV